MQYCKAVQVAERVERRHQDMLMGIEITGSEKPTNPRVWGLGCAFLCVVCLIRPTGPVDLRHKASRQFV